MMDTDTPKITRRLILFLASLTTSAALYAQTCKPVNGACPTITGVTCSFAATIEKGCNCYDNVDNDGDGLVDANDVDCAPYLTTYVGSGSTCTLPPPTSGPGIFNGVTNAASSSQNTSDTPAHAAIGDMNGDGVPDAVITSKWNSTIQVVATATASGFSPGDIMGDYTTPGSKIFSSTGGDWVFEHETAIADINGDKIGEMYTIVSQRKGGPNNPPTNFALCGFKYASGKGNLVPLFNAVDLGVNRPGNPGLADFDGDGKAELYIRNQIYAAESGVKLADGGGNWLTAINTGSVAVDIDGDGKLELVCGNFIYKVPSLSSRTLQTLTVYKDMNTDFPAQKFYPKGYNDVNEYGITQASTTSVADFDEDGYIDVFITGAISCSGNEASPCGNNKTTIFYWNVHKNTLKTYSPPDASYPLGWVWGTGRVNLYDAYPNHEKLEALFMAGKSLYCLDNSTFTTGNPLWVRNTPNDALSGILSVTCYDFDNDGNVEVVYRDTQQLSVCDGKTGQTTIWATTCQSHTMTEGPIIADVNGDGATDICVPCYTNTGAFDINKSTPQQQSLGQLHLYYTNASTWLPTRKVWNQHPYFVVNINDNLTLPTSQISQGLIFGTGACPNGVQGPQMPLNLFMDQVPHLSASGCPEFPAPDITFYGDTPSSGCGIVGGSSPPAGCDTNGDGKYIPTVVIIPPICGNLGISAYFNIVNNGDLAISDNIPVSFFNGDPTANPVTATKLFSTTFTVTNLGIGSTYTSPTYTFNGPGNTFTLYVVIYNDGTSLPITLTGSSTHECSISNNMYSTVIAPSPFTVTTEVVQNNLNCPPYNPPNNGQLRSRIYINGVEQTDYSPYAFQWYDAGGNPIAGATLYNLSNLDQGNYYVKVTNTQKGCSSALVQGTITRANPAFPAFNFTNVSEQTICSPANGERIISAVDGSTGYTFTWLDLALNPIGVTGADAKNLVAGTYSVQIQKGTCICQDPVTGGPCAQTSVSGPQYPIASATKLTDVVDCLNPNSGSVTADALLGAVVQNPANYTFDWYFYNAGTSTRGSILPAGNGTGQTRTALAAGSYQVVVTDNTTKCAATTSPIATVNTSTVQPTANIIQVAPQTSCDPNQPNGILTATGTAAGYTSPTDFKFEWFRGDNTLAANLIPIAGGPETVSGAKGETLNKAMGGGVIYTVRVTTPLNCQATYKLPLTETVVQPVVTLSQTPNDICDAAKTSPAVLYDGSVTATVTFNGTTVSIPDPNYTFNWYDGTTTTTAHNPATTATNTITGLQDSKFFTVVANRNDLHCSSVPQNIMVQKASVQPVLQATSTGSNNCDPALTPDGTATVNIVTAPLPPGHTYTYQWYEINPGTGAVVATLGGANNGTSQTAIKLGGPYSPNKQYMVDVIDRTNGCENTTTQSVSDVSVVPVLTTTTTPNSICSPASSFNGSMTAAVTIIPVGYTISDYTFSWYNGNTTGTPHVPASSAATLSTLDVGTYSVTGKNTKTGCISSLYTNNVIPAKIFPALQPASTGSNNCDPALTPDGTVSYSVTNLAQDPGPFVQQWYVGNGDPIANGLTALPSSPNNGNLVTAIKVGGPTGAPKPYTVLVTNTTTGCTNYTTASVPDNSVIPVLTTATTGNGVCDPALGFIGTMSVTVTNIPVVYTITDYSFTWYDGATTATQHAPQPSPASTTILGSLDSKTFSVVGTNTKTGCVSAIYTNTVPNTKVFPVLTTSSTGSNNCDPAITPDGTVTVAASGTVGPYGYQWYVGSGDPIVGGFTTVPTAGNNGQSATAIKLGGPVGAPNSYTALVTDQTTGCTAFRTAIVADISVQPILASTTQPNDICSPATSFAGSMTVSLANNPPPPVGAFPADYAFTWYDGNTTATPHATQPVPNSTPTLSQLDAGTYSVVGTNTKTGCVATLVTNIVDDQKVNPALQLTTIGSNNCTNAVTPDGSATATVTNNTHVPADNYNFVWASVAPTTAINATNNNVANNTTTSTAIKLGGPTNAPNSYQVTVTNNRTGCVTINTAQVSDLSQKPTFSLAATDNSVCANALGIPFNGHVDASGITHPQLAGSTITYTWYNADPLTSAIINPADHTDVNLAAVTDSWTALGKGNYAATVTITSVDCTSDPIIVSVKDVPVYPAFSVTPTPSTNCPGGADNGTVSATVSNAGVNTFTFDWHKGNLVTDPVVASTDLTTSTTISNQKGAQNYTVQATNNQTGCAANFTQTLADNSVKPTFTLTIVDNDKCIVPKDGKASIAGLTDPNALGTDTYTIAFTSTVSAPQTSASVDYLNQPASFATATVKNDRLGCTSAPVTNEIKDLLTYPTITTSVVNSTNCAGGNPNGSATVTGVVPADTYEYRWYAGSSVGAAGTEINGAAPGGTAGITGKQGSADFTVEVNLTSTGCRGSQTVTIQDVSQLPLITPLTVAPNHNCTAPFDGTAQVAAVPFTYHGTTITAPYTGFTLTWSTAATTDNISALGAGNYTLQVTAIAGNAVTSNNDNCISNLATAVILDQLTPPTVTSGFTAKQTSCGAPNGQMTASETSGSGSYNFDWYNGIGPVGGVIDNATATTSSTTPANLASSNYTVVVTNTVTRCSISQTTFLPDNIVPPTLALTQNTPVDDCASPNGSVQAAIGVTSMAPGDFTIYYLNEIGNNSTTDPATLEGSATKISTNPVDLVYSNLVPGYYSSIVRDEITHCESQAQTVHVDDNTNKATITINVITKATFCGVGNDGAMDITVAGGVPAYLFEWHKDGPTNAGPYNFFAGSLNLPVFTDGGGFAATEDINLVKAGLYTVVVRDSKGCGTVYSNSVPFQNAPHIANLAANSTKCDPLAGNGTLMTELVGFSNYQVKIYAGTDVTTATASPAISTSPSYGADGADNDGDGATDGADVDFDAGTNPLCTDGVDNDLDGLIDSNDPDCDAGSIATCTNGVDDDGDGLIDSADPDCDSSGGLKGLIFNTATLNPGGYIVEVMDKVVNCPLYQSITINVDALKPVVNLSVLTPNTSCTPAAAADGSLQITIDKDPLDNTVVPPVYQITGITGTAPPNAAPATDIATYPALYPYTVLKAVPKTLFSIPANGDPFTGGFGPDTYTVSVKETNSGCTVDKVITVPDQPQVPNLINFSVVDESFCAPNSNGSVTVTAVSPIAIADYDYHWYTDAGLTAQIYTAAGVAGATLNSADYAGWVNGTAGLGIGTRTYYVQGIRNNGLGKGCPTPAVQVVVQDTHVTPQMALTSLPNTSCDPAVGEGSVTISTTTAGGGAVGTSNYNYVLDPAGLNITANNKPGTPATAWFTSLMDNTYLVRATNIVSGCKTESNNTVSSSKFSLSLTNFTTQDKLMCNPDGSITVTQITTDRTLTGQANVNYTGVAPTLADNFDFRWFQTTAPSSYVDPSALVDNTATVIGTAQLTDGVGAGQYPAMGAGLFYVIAKHKTGGASDGVGQGCTTPPIQVNINDKHVNPTVTLTPFSDTSCNLVAGFEGSIEVTVTDASVTVPSSTPYDFNYSWTTTSTTTPLPITNPYTGALTTFANLQDGDYSLTAVNNMTGCQTVSNTTIIKNVTPVFVNNFTVTPQLICSNSGDITITGITYKDKFGNPQPAPVADFSFTWTRPLVGTVGNASALLNVGDYAGISADVYTVTAKRIANSPGNGCISAPINIEIQDKSIKPVPSLKVLSNTSCSNVAPGEGEIQINVTDATAAPYNGGTYTYTWNTLPATQVIAAANPGNSNGNGSSTDGDEDNPKQLLDGGYSFTITNNITGCAVVANATVLKNAVPVFVQSVNVLDQIMCTADGSLTVSKVSLNDRTGLNQDYVTAPVLPQGNISDFDFQWTRGAIAFMQTTTGAGGNVLNSGNYNPAALPGGFGVPIGADDYTVTAVRANGAPGNGCKSAPFPVTIKDKRVNPVITLTPFSNTSCSAAFEGEIKVKVTDATTFTPVPAGGFVFNYSWTSSGGVTAPGASAGNNGNELNDGAGPDQDYYVGQQDGTYNITVVNPTTQCQNVASTVITKNATPVFVQSVSVVDQILCTPDGSLTVNQVTLNDRTGLSTVFDSSTTPALLTDFQFEWSRPGDAHVEVMNSGVAPAGSSLDKTNYDAAFASQPFGAGTFTVIARRKAGSPGANCASAPYTVVIQDKSIAPVVSLTPFANTSCSGVFEGEIKVNVTDATTNNIAHTFVTPFAYSYDWTVSATPAVISGPVAGTNNGDGSGADGDGDNPQALKDGNYTVTVTNTQTGCTSPGSTTIYKNSTPVFTQQVTPTDQVLCIADGKLVVNSVNVIDRNGATKVSGTDFPISDFVFTYDRGAVGATVLGPNTASTQLDNTNYGTIGFDTYFVTATRNSGSPGAGCSAAPYKVDILDKRIFPSVSLTPLANTSCDPAFFEGEIKVKVTDASVNIPAPLTGTPFTYNYTWPTVVTAIANSLGNDGDGFGGGENDGAGIDNDKDHPTALQDGAYTVTVTNAVTGCPSNGSTTIFKNSTPVFTQLVVPTAQVLCNPDGKLVVQEVKIIDRNGKSQSNLNGDFPLADFSFAYDRTAIGNNIVPSNSPLQPVITLDNTTYPTIGFDTYYVTATRVNGFPGKNCSSAPYRVDIEDKRIYPTLAFSSIANSSCNVAKPNGSVQATASEPNGSQVDPYTFAWTLNGTPVASVVPTPPTETDVTPVSTLTNALDGAYIATVTNTNTGCPFAGSFNLLLDQTRSTPNIIDVTTIDPIDCNPSAGAEVTKITLGSTFNSSLQPPQIPPDNTVTGALLGPPRFTYTWYEGSLSNPLAYTTLPCIGPNCTTPTTGLLSGDHFVTVKDSQTDCQSGPKEFTIKTDNIIYPVASITQTVKQISCIATIGTAELQASASETDGTTGTSYTFTWYPSLDLTGTAYGPPTAPSTNNNPNVLQKLVVGNYSVQVKNNITSCTAQALFIVPDESPLFTPALSTGTTPQTFCVGTDGDAQVRILLDPNYPLLPYDNTSFTTDLYNGANPNLANPPDVQANIPFTITGSPTTITYDVPGLASGFYTFRVTDKNTGCFRTDSVNIKLQQRKPVVAITEDNPMKNCDPVIADGQLSATADGKIQGYTFDWYAGATASGSILQTDNKLIGQRAGQYTVRATVDLTGCFDDKTGTIDDATVIPPIPTAITLANQSSCITPNGEVTATVGGITLGYSFQWYNGQYTDKAKLPPAVNFKFADYTGLNVGFYSVTATDDVTHCISQPASTQVIDIRVKPAFTVDGTPSFCADAFPPPHDIDKGNGTFTLTSKVGVAFEDITWSLAGDTTNVKGIGPYVAELLPGDYHVLVTTVEGCQHSENVSIITEIKPYNLVSPFSGDQNSKFTVDCISNFPNNNVKIFNRNGTMVYEADSYDNQTVFFKGLGERGVYLSDKELPEGTYFYIIDKRNGTKPKSGFIELVR